MAGALTIDTLKASSGVLATQNGMTGICKAWVQFNGTAGGTISGSFNVGSVTKNGTGDYTVNYTTSMANANYVAVCTWAEDNSNSATGSQAGGRSVNNYATSSVRVHPIQSGSSFVDVAICGVAVFSS
jgi:hypothetical protein